MTMKFMMLVKHPENQGPPPKALMDAMVILTEEAVKNHTMLVNGGLAPTAQSTHVRVANGKLSTIDGPFSEAKEVIGGFAIFELKSKQEALDGAVRFMELHRKHWPEFRGETEMRQIFGPEDFAQCMEQREVAAVK
ncbi:MAG: YciI family protein [Candidatus Sulfotelmatobacter sp.]